MASDFGAKMESGLLCVVVRGRTMRKRSNIWLSGVEVNQWKKGVCQTCRTELGSIKNKVSAEYYFWK